MFLSKRGWAGNDEVEHIGFFIQPYFLMPINNILLALSKKVHLMILPETTFATQSWKRTGNYQQQ